MSVSWQVSITKPFLVAWTTEKENKAISGMNNYSGTFSLTWSWVNLLLATTSCIVRVSLFSFMVPAHLYLPWSLSSTSFIMRDWSQGEKDGRLLMFRSIGFPTPTFSQDVVLGLNPAEKTQGRVTADPTAAYTMVLSLGGLMIPVDEKKGNKTTSVCFTREDQCGVFSCSPLTNRAVVNCHSFLMSMTQVQLPSTFSVTISFTKLCFPLEKILFLALYWRLFNIQLTEASVGQGLTRQVMDTSSPHTGADGDMDTAKEHRQGWGKWYWLTPKLSHVTNTIYNLYE